MYRAAASYALLFCYEWQTGEKGGYLARAAGGVLYPIPGPREQEHLVTCVRNAVSEREARDGFRVAFVQLQLLPHLCSKVDLQLEFADVVCVLRDSRGAVAHLDGERSLRLR